MHLTLNDFFKAEQNPVFESLHRIAELEQDIFAVLPYLNTHLGGFNLED
ncbi:MAG: hypothetical protein PVG35_07090 [Desulfobacterales bacterium]|jgi:hypothetical protein